MFKNGKIPSNPFKYTIDANISIIRKIIDNKIILPYFRKEE